MAAQIPTPAQAPNNNSSSIKSAASKLPIKRKTPAQQQPQPQSQIQTPVDPIPILNPNPNPISRDPHADLLPNGGASSSVAYDDYDDDDDYDDEEDNFGGRGGSDVTLSSSAAAGNGGGGDQLKRAPPFKFHRIWSESDEIRFLQGLLGCWSQGLVFPRDLNIFYDRFSESMPQPYTRSQLSEKLRRLRKKFRIMSGRIARGQDPNRLAPHDRDLLHLCTRLWDPGYASTSPFSAPDPASSGSGGNKRRRPSPRTPAAAARPKVEGSPLLPAPPAPPTPAPAATSEKNPEFNSEKEEGEDDALAGEKPRFPVPSSTNVFDNASKGEDIGYVAAKTVLDVFDGSLKELRMTIKGDGPSGNELARRWQEQRVAELDVFARRLRLVLEQSLRN